MEKSVMRPNWIVPNWPAPANVRAVSTTRAGGFSPGPWRSLNLGLNCGDDPALVRRNRAVLRRYLPAEPCWLRQEHGVAVYRHPGSNGTETGSPAGWGPAAPTAAPLADAQVASQPGQVCVVLTADCLPVLLCNRNGQRVAAAHAGWRGLAAGVLEQTVAAMGEAPDQLLAWLGPAIGPHSYAVGDEVREAFMCQDEAAHAAFIRQGGGWLLDLYAVARQRLSRLGVTAISGGDCCTFADPERFYSFRRDGTTGRMASLVWLDAHA
ncbi:MAG TPA: peptidoglycan editing factor PgeF [Xanthomonadales bacterium]|nr:peptidoglycan editing factor PgeF [Xanthomonadales bacterium]